MICSESIREHKTRKKPVELIKIPLNNRYLRFTFKVFIAETCALPAVAPGHYKESKVLGLCYNFQFTLDSCDTYFKMHNLTHKFIFQPTVTTVLEMKTKCLTGIKYKCLYIIIFSVTSWTFLKN